MPLRWNPFPAWNLKSSMDYKEEDFLQLSGLQHFKFCRRRWALIHIENQWAENYRTIDGSILHQNAHDSQFRESRGDRVITRGVSIHSSLLGVSGQCDVLEYHREDTGIPLAGKEGLWQPYPVEYKRGSPRKNTAAAYRQELRKLQPMPEPASKAACHHGPGKGQPAVLLSGKPV